MQYTSTRDAQKRVSAAQAILTGLSPDGGLFVPTQIPRMDFAALAGKNYCEVAFAVLKAYLPDYDEAFLRRALEESYTEPFGGKAGLLKKVADGLYSLELWHGPTAAFKDYALQLMPKLLLEARNMLAETGETLILVATSGDTGSAALAGYAGVPGTKIAAFYPMGGTSQIQRLQMVTQEGDNVEVFEVNGNFDDAQKGVKAAFGNEALREALAAQNVKLSSANSINWGRLVPQLVYYITSYLQLCAQGVVVYGQPIDFCVPTGNFGDIMAGYYAKAMGLPVGRLICAANRNNVLADFLKTGCYNAQRPFYKTSSPSMDILVSSNLERLLYHASGSAAAVRGWMEQLAKDGCYEVDAATLAHIRKTFATGWAEEEAVGQEIQTLWHKYHYLSDPHTAVAFRVLQQTAGEGKATVCVVLSTASPFKFGEKVLDALRQPHPQNTFEAIDALQKISGQAPPASLAQLRGKPVRFTKQIAPEEIQTIPLHI